MQPRPEDLFGEVPVTWDEVWARLEVVPGIALNSWRAHYYLKYWDVPAKIRVAKINGTFEATIGEAVRNACFNGRIPEQLQMLNT